MSRLYVGEFGIGKDDTAFKLKIAEMEELMVSTG